MQAIKRPESQQPLPSHAKKVFEGVLFDVYQWEQELFDGSIAIFEKLKRDDTVLVIPITKDGKIILTEQEQPGKQPFLSFAGGRIDKGEPVIEAAKRELLEETGYKSETFDLLNAVQPSSKIEWAVYTLIAKGCEKVHEQNLDKGEKIRLKIVSFDDFIEIVTLKNFHEVELTMEVLHARLDKERMKRLKQLLS